MQHHTDIAGRDPCRYLAEVDTPDKLDVVGQLETMNLCFKRYFGAPFANQETLNGRKRLHNNGDGIDERIEAMPGEKPTDKPEVWSLIDQ